jgi:hypothetical protein
VFARYRLSLELHHARAEAGLTGVGLTECLGWDRPRVSRTDLHGWVVRDDVVTVEHADGNLAVAAPGDVARYVAGTARVPL